MKQNLNFDDIKGIEFSSFPDGVVIEVAKAIAASWPINLMELIDLIESFGYLPFVEMHADYIVIENLKELRHDYIKGDFMAVVNTFDKTNQTQKYKIGGKQNEKTRGNNRGFQKAGCGRRVEPHPTDLGACRVSDRCNGASLYQRIC